MPNPVSVRQALPVNGGCATGDTARGEMHLIFRPDRASFASSSALFGRQEMEDEYLHLAGLDVKRRLLDFAPDQL